MASGITPDERKEACAPPCNPPMIYDRVGKEKSLQIFLDFPPEKRC
jgi:hypothetical protein